MTVFPRQRTVSMKEISSTSGSSSVGKSWATTGDLSGDCGRPCEANIRKKRIKFSPSVRVVLIPTIMEYLEANIGDLIWWSEHDFRVFKEDAVQELKEHLKKCPNDSAKQAIKNMYGSSSDREVYPPLTLCGSVLDVRIPSGADDTSNDGCSSLSSDSGCPLDMGEDITDRCRTGDAHMKPYARTNELPHSSSPSREGSDQLSSMINNFLSPTQHRVYSDNADSVPDEMFRYSRCSWL